MLCQSSAINSVVIRFDYFNVFGQTPKEVDEDKVWDALAAAQLDEIVSELSGGLYTPIGDNGISLLWSTSKVSL